MFSIANYGWVGDWLRNSSVRCVFLIVICFIVYAPALRSGYVWDDRILITENPLVTNPEGLSGIWKGQINPDYYPLTSTLFWLEFHLWGANPFGYHFINILLHSIAVKSKKEGFRR